MRYFSLAEAEAQIPQLEKIISIAIEIKAKAEAKLAHIQALEAKGHIDPVRHAIERAQLEFLAQSLEETLRATEKIGAVLKGLEPALVDFPHRLNGQEVYLCWKRGEEKIGHYHGLEEGFAGRKPLPRDIVQRQ